MRGGVSDATARGEKVRTSSPRAWGCFFDQLPPAFKVMVFPTCVGVFPSFLSRTKSSAGLPHVRGGVSVPAVVVEALRPSSPRAWGCF